MIAAFLAAEGEHMGRWERDDDSGDPDPWAMWIVRMFALALAVFWSVVISMAVELAR